MRLGRSSERMRKIGERFRLPPTTRHIRRAPLPLHARFVPSLPLRRTPLRRAARPARSSRVSRLASRAHFPTQLQARQFSETKSPQFIKKLNVLSASLGSFAAFCAPPLT